MKKEKEEKSKCLVNEIMNICKDLGVKINTQKPDAENKFLSAWNKGVAH